MATPPWVDTTSDTWDVTKKVAVSGHVTWHSQFSAQLKGSDEVFIGNGLPPLSGTFPVAKTDPADAYNPDPGSITAHNIRLSVPYSPNENSQPTCESGTVGLAINGIPILDGFDAGGYDAGAVEVQDTCHGHPNTNSGYHYHSLSPCLLTNSARTDTALVGWALDGFGIYVEYDAAGHLLTNADLDACHGRTSAVPWHGKTISIYHYDMTLEFPYTVGCFRGTPASFKGLLLTSASSSSGNSVKGNNATSKGGTGSSKPGAGKAGKGGAGKGTTNSTQPSKGGSDTPGQGRGKGSPTGSSQPPKNQGGSGQGAPTGSGQPPRGSGSGANSGAAGGAPPSNSPPAGGGGSAPGGGQGGQGGGPPPT